MSEEQNEQQPVDLSSLGGFGFAPAWATGKPDDKSSFAKFEGRDENRASGERRAFSERRNSERRPSGPKPQFDRDRDRSRSQKPMGDREERPRFPSRRPDRPPREFIKPLDVDVRILPNQKDLGGIIRKIQTTHCAYPLKQLAHLFLENPASCVLRVSQKKGAAESLTMYQCKSCGFVGATADELSAHILATHIGDYYEINEIDCEPPKGSFACVAKCGLSGVWLGPPNLHGYDARIRDMVRTRYPDMSEDAYRARIEMVRSPEAVEEWRATATKKTVYRRKVQGNAEEVPAIEREAAELEFRRDIMPGLMSEVKSADIPADVALKTSWRALLFACRDALSKEKRFPASLSYALRGAFHHRKLVFFRANDPHGQEFVCAAPMQPLDREHAVPELAAVVTFVEEHPDATRASVPAEGREHLDWLIEKGHLVCYFNGVLALPGEHPRCRPPRHDVQSKTAEVIPASEAPAAETPVEAPAVEAAVSAESTVEAPVVETPAEPTPTAEASAVAES